MKINKIINLLIVSLLLGFSSCEPIVDELHLKNNTTADNVELVASQNSNGGNAITLDMRTPGVTGYWDYVIGKGLSNRIDIVYPVTGTFDFKFVGTLGAEFFEKSTTVTIENLDTPADPEWSYLLGDDAIAGKTWVLAKGRPAGIDPYPQEPEMFSFMTAPYNWLELWWNASGCCPPEDHNAEMTFDLNGAPNYTYNNEGDVKKGFFALDTKNATLTIQGADLVGAYGAPGQIGGTQNGLYQLKMINDNEMILYQIHGTGWTWIFKPKGHVY